MEKIVYIPFTGTVWWIKMGNTRIMISKGKGQYSKFGTVKGFQYTHFEKKYQSPVLIFGGSKDVLRVIQH